MNTLARLWEILSGTPHLRRNADMVSLATISLSKKTQELETATRTYAESDDPLTAVMYDLYEQRRRNVA